MSEQKVIPYFEILEDVMIQQIAELNEEAMRNFLLRIDETYAVYDTMTIMYVDGHDELRDFVHADAEFSDILRRSMMYYTRAIFERYHAHVDTNPKSTIIRGMVTAINTVRDMASEADIENGRIMSADCESLDIMVVLAVILLELIRKTDFDEEEKTE